jgi:hypothetical protein
MTALTADRKTSQQEGKSQSYPVGADAVIYLGSIVCIDSTDGYAYPGADTANFLFVGIAEESVDATGLSDGDISVKVRRVGIHHLAATGLAITDVGTLYYVLDDQTVAVVGTTTNDVLVGRLAFFDSATNAPIQLMPATGPVS